MKKLILSILITSLSVTIYGQRKIKKLEVKEEGFNIKMSYTPVVNQLEVQGLNIKVTPLSTDNLNQQLYSESAFNGKFEYSNYEKSRNSYFLKRSRKKSIKTDIEFFLEGIQWLLNNKTITEEEYEKLYKKIVYYYDKEEATKMYNASSFLATNPYYMGNKYLSVFKIEITNSSNEAKTFINNIMIENGQVLLTPLSAAHIRRELASIGMMNMDRSEALTRHNLNNITLVPPKSKFTKYIAVLPIDYKEPLVNVSFKESSKKMQWEIKKDLKTIDQLYTFYDLNYKLLYASTALTTGQSFNLLLGSSKSIFLGNSSLYIGEENLDEEFEILSIYLSTSKFYHGRLKSNGATYVNSSKGKRIIVQVDMTPVQEITRKGD